jgi:hypothetical protein
MSKLETSIAEWRARMTEALPQRDEAVAELEEHLREHMAKLQRQGKSDDEAFALAQERIGEPHAIAREFDRMPASWRPGLILLPVLALILAFLLGGILYNYWERRLSVGALHPKWDQLYLVSIATSFTGYFGIFGSALIATGAFMKTSRRPLSERERQAVRRLLGKLARIAAIFISIGWALSTLWLARFQGTHWSLHLRLAGPLFSVALLIFAQSRPAASHRVGWIMAILPCLVVVFASFGRFIRVADISVAWLCVVFLLGQVFFALPRFRIRIERLREPY